MVLGWCSGFGAGLLVDGVVEARPGECLVGLCGPGADDVGGICTSALGGGESEEGKRGGEAGVKQHRGFCRDPRVVWRVVVVVAVVVQRRWW